MSSELQEALLAANASALINKIIDPMLLEYQRRYSPLVRAIPTQKWASDTYFFNQRTVNPNGGFVNDGGARVVSNSQYVQNSFPIRHFQTVGALTGYAQEVTKQIIGDLRAREIQGAVQSQYWDIENGILWGNRGATEFGPYQQFDGLDAQIDQYSGQNQNCVDCSGFDNLLHAMDSLADMVENNAAMSVFDSSWMFVMSNTAVSKVSQLVQQQQRFVDKVDVAAGLNVSAYRDIPMIKTSFLSARKIYMSTVTATAGAAPSGVVGAMAAGDTTYAVSAVIARQGEIQATPAINVTGVTANQVVKLQFVTPTGLDGATPTLYKVYRKDPFGHVTLLGTVDAVVGLAADGITPVPTVQILDTGSTLIPLDANGNRPLNYPPAYVGTNRGRVPMAEGQERIYLMSRDEQFVVRPYVRELAPIDVFPTVRSPDSLPYALMTDTTLAVRGPKFLGCATGVNVGLATS